MFYKVIDIFQNFEELKYFGKNFLTLTFLATLVFTAMSIIALVKQRQEIIKYKSAASVSLLYYSILIFSAFGFMIYGYYKARLALLLNGFFVGVFGLRVVLVLVRYYKYSLIQLLGFFSAAIFIPLIIFLPDKDILFLIFGLVLLFAIVKQTFILLKNKVIGSLHPGQAYVGVIASLFWLIYGFLLKSWPMEILYIITILSWLALIIVYFFNKKRFFV